MYRLFFDLLRTKKAPFWELVQVIHRLFVSFPLLTKGHTA